jgi:hypothetical protein
MSIAISGISNALILEQARATALQIRLFFFWSFAVMHALMAHVLMCDAIQMTTAMMTIITQKTSVFFQEHLKHSASMEILHAFKTMTAVLTASSES